MYYYYVTKTSVIFKTKVGVGRERHKTKKNMLDSIVALYF
jgi:hypothetical protein